MLAQKEKCDFCNGLIVEKQMAVDFHYKKKLVIIEDVPVKVCIECGERYYDAKVWGELERIAKSDKNIKREVKVPVKEFAIAI